MTKDKELQEEVQVDEPEILPKKVEPPVKLVPMDARNCIKQACGSVKMEVFDPTYGWCSYMATPDGQGVNQLMYNLAHLGEFGDFVEEEPEVFDEETTAMMVRAERDSKVNELDRLVSSPLRWAEFSEEQKERLGNYRQLLLDVPQQSGFPFDSEFPSIDYSEFTN